MHDFSLVRDQEVPSSNPRAPTILFNNFRFECGLWK